MIRTVSKWMVCMFFVWGNPCVEAESSSPPGFTADELVAQALARNAELRFYEAELDAAKGQRTQAGLWKNPEFSGEYGTRRVSDDGGVLQGEGYTRGFSITQTFEFPGKGSLRKAIADKDVEMAELGLQQFRRSLEGRVRSLALQYAAATANAAAAEEVGERSAGLVALLRERPAAGPSQLLELRVIEGSLIGLQQSARRFIQEREEARIEMNALLGRPASQPLQVSGRLEPPGFPLPDADALVMAGLSRNLQLRMRTAELEKASKAVSAARLEVAPDFTVGPFFTQDKAGDKEENLGGTLSVALPLWNWNQGNAATAMARREQADALLLDARRKVEAEIVRRLRAWELIQRQLGRTRDGAIRELREAADLADRQYRTGGIGVQLFLEVQREYLAAQEIQGEAVLEAWNNWLDLMLLTGGEVKP